MCHVLNVQVRATAARGILSIVEWLLLIELRVYTCDTVQYRYGCTQVRPYQYYYIVRTVVPVHVDVYRLFA